MGNDDSEDHSSLPPGIVLLWTKFVDVTLGVLFPNWRSALPGQWVEGDAGWFSPSFAVGDVTKEFPALLTFEDFVGSSDAVEPNRFWSFGNVWKYAFGTSSTQLSDATSLTSCGVLVVMVLGLRWMKYQWVLPYFSKVGRRLGRQTHGVAWEKDNEVRIVKFGEYVFRLLFHCGIGAYGLRYAMDKPWWDPAQGGTRNVFVGYPHHQVDPGMTWLYLIQATYNLEALVSLGLMSLELRWNGWMPRGIFWKSTVRGDFQEMAIHHVATNSLVLCSSFFRLTRIGSMVFLVHDISDVPVDLSKLAHFVKWRLTTSVCFAIMTLVWFLTRLAILPGVIVRAVFYESHLLISKTILPVYYYAYRPIFYTLIVLLQLLHVIWFLMFLRMAWFLVFKSELHDLSEHKKGEAQTNTKTNKKTN